MAELTPKENLKPPKPQNVIKQNRITLTNESGLKVDTWLQQINSKIIGKALNKNDLVNWLITNKENVFSEKDISHIHKSFYDPLKALEFTLNQAKAARKRGETLDLKELLRKSSPHKKSQNPSKPKPEGKNDDHIV